MSKGASSRAAKAVYFERLRSLFETHTSVFIVTLDNIGSKQLQDLRRKLRGEAQLVVGKNTAIRYLLREMLTTHPKLANLIPLVRGNTGFVFTNGDLKLLCKRVTEDRIVAPAKTGALSPVEVVIPAGKTGLDPAKTSFFQTLGIATKIVKSLIEITTSFLLLKPGQRVGASDALLLNMLSISPFSYGVNVLHVYSNGSVFAPELLDVDDETLTAKILEGIRNVAAFSLGTGIPTAASIPHTIIDGYKNILAVAISTGVTFPLAEAVIDRINNPEAYSSAGATATATADGPKDASAFVAAPSAAVEEEEEEDDEEGLGFDLFD